jgi:hypothetical protein
LQEYANQHEISLHSVFLQVRSYTKSLGFTDLKVDEKSIHTIRSISRGQMVSSILFKPMPPGPATYIAAVNNTFQSPQKIIVEKKTGLGCIQQILDVSLGDARALHQELIR